MKTNLSTILILSVFCTFIFSCKNDGANPALVSINATIDSLKNEYAPDRRVARLDVEVKYGDGRYTFTGESDQIQAVDVLLGYAQKLEIAFMDSIRRLPDETTWQFPYAVVNNSVANIRSQPRHSAELATQATLGTALKVLKITDEWYMVQTPDDYISWVDHGGVKLMTAEEFESWEQAEKVIVTIYNAAVLDGEGSRSVVSDVVLGNKLVVLDKSGDDFIVQFPDGRTGKLNKANAMKYEQWLATVQTSGDSIEKYARGLMGVPYLWGGTSAKGMDCSGFTKTVYFMNGLVIPRDASQQIEAGDVIDENLAFEDLVKGDLLFFGKPATDSTKRKTTHVGIWLGNDQFIHASKRVRISSIDPESEYYDEFNKNRYLGSRRYIGSTNGNILDLRKQITLK